MVAKQNGNLLSAACKATNMCTQNEDKAHVRCGSKADLAGSETQEPSKARELHRAKAYDEAKEALDPYVRLLEADHV